MSQPAYRYPVRRLSDTVVWPDGVVPDRNVPERTEPLNRLWSTDDGMPAKVHVDAGTRNHAAIRGNNRLKHRVAFDVGSVSKIVESRFGGTGDIGPVVR